MNVIPAVDVLDHNVVQLVGGVAERKEIVLSDPFAVAMSWVNKGAPYLHIVDLDGAFGKGDNLPVFKRIIKECGVPVEIGGGIRSDALVDELISVGADRIIVGTKAVKEPEWLSEIADRHPGKIVLGLDTKNGEIAVNGWQGSANLTVRTMFDIIWDIPLCGVLNTNVNVEGQMGGIDISQAEDFISNCPHSVIASGGVTSEKDCSILKKLGAVGAVVGLAIYTERIRPWEWKTPWVPQ